MDPAGVQRLHSEPAMAITPSKRTTGGPSVKVTRIGLDIAKQIFELHGVDRRGRVVVRKTLRRERVLEYFSQLPACEVALEACSGAHYWHRELCQLGHSVRLLPAHKVKPYLDGNKNNANDAAAICEASSRPSMRWVEPKTIAQQDLQSLHRVRQVTVRQCTLLANQFNVNGRRRTGLTLIGTVGNKTESEYALRSALVTIGSDPSNELVI